MFSCKSTLYTLTFSLPFQIDIVLITAWACCCPLGFAYQLYSRRTKQCYPATYVRGGGLTVAGENSLLHGMHACVFTIGVNTTFCILTTASVRACNDRFLCCICLPSLPVWRRLFVCLLCKLLLISFQSSVLGPALVSLKL